MRIVDVCAFYSPMGGGVRTYVEAKMRAAPRFGHEIIILAPGARHEVVDRGPGAYLVTIPAPTLPVDRRYRYFDDERLLHATLDAWKPDHVEASSPWSSATMVARWKGAATRSLVMHADPLAAYAYRWLGGLASQVAIDRWFGWFWRHLQSLGRSFDAVVCASSQLAERLGGGGVPNTQTIRMGVEPDLFSPSLRSPDLRRAALAAMGLDRDAVLLIGVGRLSPEKRWELVLRAAGECGRKASVGMILVGDGSRRRKLQILADSYRNLALLPPITDRRELASLFASADALVHGCESETFCLVAAEARASGIPLIVPDRGAAIEQLVAGSGTSYLAGRQGSLERAILRFIDKGPELQRAAARCASNPRTMDEHFADLFARYRSLPGRGAGQAATASPREAPAPLDARREVALAPSNFRTRSAWSFNSLTRIK